VNVLLSRDTSGPYPVRGRIVRVLTSTSDPQFNTLIVSTPYEARSQKSFIDHAEFIIH